MKVHILLTCAFFMKSCLCGSIKYKEQINSGIKYESGDTVFLSNPELPIISKSNDSFSMEPQFQFGDDSLNLLLRKNMSRYIFAPDFYNQSIEDSIYFSTAYLEFDSMGNILSIKKRDLDLDSGIVNLIKNLKFKPAFIQNKLTKEKRYINDYKVIEIPYYFESYRKDLNLQDQSK